MDLAAIQGRLKEGIARGDLAPVLKQLRDLLPEASPRYNEVVVLLSRLNDANRKRLREELTQDELQKAYALIRIELLDLIDGLTPADFDPNAKPAGKDVRRGHVLYRVPNVMRQDEETRCIVRIAQEEDSLVEDLDLDEHIRTREIRISNTMQVELLDPSGDAAFRIRTISEGVQLIDEDDFTEWHFFVTPLRSGVFPLILKVSIIELVDSLPRKREKVLEARVEVVTEGPLSDEEPVFQPAGYAFACSSGTLEGVAVHYQPTPVYSPERQTPQPPHYQPSDVIAPAPQRARAGNGLRRTALLLAALVAVSGATWAVTPAAERDWLWTRYVQNSEAAYEAYIQKHEGRNVRRLEQAYWRKAVLTDAPEAYLDYLEHFPEAEVAARAEVTLPQLEQTIFSQLETKPVLESLRIFLRVFPESGQVERVRAMLDSLSLSEVLAPEQEPAQPGENKATASNTPPSGNHLAELSGESEGVKESGPPQAVETETVSGEASLDRAKEDRLWTFVQKQHDLKGYQTYLDRYPQGRYVDKVRAQIRNLELGYGSFTDPAGHHYRTLRLAGLTWLADNLHIETAASWCYDNDPANCAKYGRLYTWEEAKKACVKLGAGWRLPTEKEWRSLHDSYGNGYRAYEELIGQGNSGFAALLGGSRNPDGGFYGIGDNGRYWSATEYSGDRAWYYNFDSGFDGKLSRSILYGKGLGFSCRCVQEAPSNGND